MEISQKILNQALLKAEERISQLENELKIDKPLVSSDLSVMKSSRGDDAMSTLTFLQRSGASSLLEEQRSTYMSQLEATRHDIKLAMNEVEDKNRSHKIQLRRLEQEHTDNIQQIQNRYKSRIETLRKRFEEENEANRYISITLAFDFILRKRQMGQLWRAFCSWKSYAIQSYSDKTVHNYMHITKIIEGMYSANLQRGFCLAKIAINHMSAKHERALLSFSFAKLKLENVNYRSRLKTMNSFAKVIRHGCLRVSFAEWLSYALSRSRIDRTPFHTIGIRHASAFTVEFITQMRSNQLHKSQTIPYFLQRLTQTHSKRMKRFAFSRLQCLMIQTRKLNSLSIHFTKYLLRKSFSSWRSKLSRSKLSRHHREGVKLHARFFIISLINQKRHLTDRYFQKWRLFQSLVRHQCLIVIQVARMLRLKSRVITLRGAFQRWILFDAKIQLLQRAIHYWVDDITNLSRRKPKVGTIRHSKAADYTLSIHNHSGLMQSPLRICEERKPRSVTFKTETVKSKFTISNNYTKHLEKLEVMYRWKTLTNWNRCVHWVRGMAIRKLIRQFDDNRVVQHRARHALAKWAYNVCQENNHRSILIHRIITRLSNTSAEQRHKHSAFLVWRNITKLMSKQIEIQRTIEEMERLATIMKEQKMKLTKQETNTTSRTKPHTTPSTEPFNHRFALRIMTLLFEKHLRYSVLIAWKTWRKVHVDSNISRTTELETMSVPSNKKMVNKCLSTRSLYQVDNRATSPVKELLPPSPPKITTEDRSTSPVKELLPTPEVIEKEIRVVVERPVPFVVEKPVPMAQAMPIELFERISNVATPQRWIGSEIEAPSKPELVDRACQTIQLECADQASQVRPPDMFEKACQFAPLVCVESVAVQASETPTIREVSERGCQIKPEYQSVGSSTRHYFIYEEQGCQVEPSTKETATSAIPEERIETSDTGVQCLMEPLFDESPDFLIETEEAFCKRSTTSSSAHHRHTGPSLVNSSSSYDMGLEDDDFTVGDSTRLHQRDAETRPEYANSSVDMDVISSGDMDVKFITPIPSPRQAKSLPQKVPIASVSVSAETKTAPQEKITNKLEVNPPKALQQDTPEKTPNIVASWHNIDDELEQATNVLAYVKTNRVETLTRELEIQRNNNEALEKFLYWTSMAHRLIHLDDTTQEKQN